MNKPIAATLAIFTISVGTVIIMPESLSLWQASALMITGALALALALIAYLSEGRV